MEVTMPSPYSERKDAIYMTAGSLFWTIGKTIMIVTDRVVDDGVICVNMYTGQQQRCTRGSGGFPVGRIFNITRRVNMVNAYTLSGGRTFLIKEIPYLMCAHYGDGQQILHAVNLYSGNLKSMTGDEQVNEVDIRCSIDFNCNVKENHML